jgi:hypothetical protein
MFIDVLEVMAELLHHEGIWWNGGITLLQSRAGFLGRGKNLLPLVGFELRIRQSVA